MSERKRQIVRKYTIRGSRRAKEVNQGEKKTARIRADVCRTDRGDQLAGFDSQEGSAQEDLAGKGQGTGL